MADNLTQEDLDDFKEWFKTDFPEEADRVDELDVLLEEE
jgi:hypothetical protein